MFKSKELITAFFTALLAIFIPFLASAQATAPNTVKPDTSKKAVNTNDRLDAKVSYTCKDSMIFDIPNEKIYLYGNAEVNYKDINLKAAYIELSMKDNIAFAKGIPDSTGKLSGNPEFKEGDNAFNSKTMTYNFETKKGRITEVLTQEGDGFIHGETVKKNESDEYYIKDGKYTTCNDKEHPHFYIKASKLKIIPDDKIVTGPADLQIMGVPTPLMVPFGFFPNKKGQKSGFLIPAPGESQNIGFFLKDGGYYWGINDRVDLTLRGDIYSRGSYAVRGLSNYNKRYKYSGNLLLGYSFTKFGDKEFPGYNTNKNYNIVWRHTQDAKAHPNRTFGADVNFLSAKYNQFNTTNANLVLNNTFQSNIVYNKRFPNSPFNFTANASQNQNTITRDLNFVLPGAALNMNTIYPFRNSKRTKSSKVLDALDAVGLSSSVEAKNQVTVKDTMLKYLVRPDTLFRKSNNGLQARSSLITSFKVLKFISLSPNASASGSLYTKSLHKDYIIARNYLDTYDSNYVKTDTIKGFTGVYNATVGINATTKIYGMYQFYKGPLKAIRHVVTPSVGYSYVPVFKQNPFGRYGYGGRGAFYDPYQMGIYGGYNQTEQGNVNFSLINNLEMKVKNKKDTVNGEKKVKLFENLSFNTSYNIFADSLNWSPIIVNARTYLFEKININATAQFSPYVLDTATGRSINKFELNENGRIGRLSTATVGFNFDVNNRNKKQSTKNTDAAELQMINANPDAYIDFSVPWNLSVSYSLTYTENKQPQKKTTNTQSSIIQSVRFYGDVSLSSKWKVGFNSGYDVISQKLTYTTLDIYRDLHCWEMRFQWVPFGPLQSYMFTINVKSGTLQDLKLSRNRSWYDLK